MSGPPAFRTLLLDSHGLSALADRDPVMGRYLELAVLSDARVLVPWTVLAETLHGTGKRSREHAISRLTLVPLLEPHYRSAAELMDRAAMGGHTVDALVASAALGCEPPVVVATSDPKDLRALLRGQARIVVVAI